LAQKTSCYTQYRYDFIAIAPPSSKEWLRGLDSNQDNQIQSLVCCQLHHPGVDEGNSNYLAVDRFANLHSSSANSRESAVDSPGMFGTGFIAFRTSSIPRYCSKPNACSTYKRNERERLRDSQSPCPRISGSACTTADLQIRLRQNCTHDCAVFHAMATCVELAGTRLAKIQRESIARKSDWQSDSELRARSTPIDNICGRRAQQKGRTDARPFLLQRPLPGLRVFAAVPPPRSAGIF
jgi:hypothetical protein